MSKPDVARTKHKGDGHRSRLRQRFLESGIDSLLDYEIIELLLTLGTPRRDCKSMAKEAVREFGGLRTVLEASSADLQKIKGIGPSNAFGLKLFQAVSERLARERISEKIEFGKDQTIVEYLRSFIGLKQTEHFVVLYVDAGRKLIESRIISVGVLDSSLVHPREVFQPAIVLGAAYIVVAHNHPSGNVEPSTADRAVTKQLSETGRIMGIELRDHLIVSKTDHFSFKQQLLI